MCGENWRKDAEDLAAQLACALALLRRWDGLCPAPQALVDDTAALLAEVDNG